MIGRCTTRVFPSSVLRLGTEVGSLHSNHLFPHALLLLPEPEQRHL